MTETTGVPYQGTQPDSEASTRDVAKDEAKGVAQDAVHAGRQTVGTAKQQAGEVAGEAASQAKRLFDEARQQLTSQGSSQKERTTSQLRSLADELTGLARGESQPEGIAGDLVREASERVSMVADWLESREPADVLRDVRSFARRRPGVFLLSAAALGFVGGRLTRSVASEVREERESGATGGSVGLSEGYANVSAPALGVTSGYPVETSSTSFGAGDLDAPADVTAGGGVPATADLTSDLALSPDLSTGLDDVAPAAPGYAVPPTGGGEGDLTTEYAPNAPDTGLGEASTDQMPSEFGARGTGAAGNRAEDRS